jgi:hypothetical protein
MTKRTYTKSQGDSPTSLTLKAAKKRSSIPIRGDNEELLAWERIDAKGLFELYRVNTGGPYFVRRSRGQSVEEYR